MCRRSSNAVSELLLANPFVALGEALRNPLECRWPAIDAVPAGAALGDRPCSRFTAIPLAGAAIFGDVELGQVFLPSRYPDGTDVLLGALGTCCGALGTRLVLSGAVRPNLSQRRLERLDLGRRLQAGVERNRAVQVLTGRVGRPAA